MNKFLITLTNNERHLVNETNLKKYGDLAQYDDSGAMISEAKYAEGVEHIERKRPIETIIERHLSDSIYLSKLMAYQAEDMAYQAENRVSTSGLLKIPVKYMWEEYYTWEKNWYYNITTNAPLTEFVKLSKETGRGYLGELLRKLASINATVTEIKNLGIWSENKQNCITNYGGVFYGSGGPYLARDW